MIPKKNQIIPAPVNYPVIGGKYFHYKGGIYEVIMLATHSETDEPMVIYKSLLYGSNHARPLHMWNEKIEGKMKVGSKTVINPKRFTLMPND